jgi:hypothetical protein
VSWPTALAVCLARQGTLAVIQDAGEMRFLVETMVADQRGFGDADSRAWIGLNDRENENEFVWANGDDASFRIWHPEEPNDLGGEDCVSLLFRDELYAWYDLPCGRELDFICMPE